jgi:hypothetical protein
LSGWLLDAVLDLNAHGRNGVGAIVRDGVKRLTGREPGTLDGFLDANIAAFRERS